ncbi:hypothetical protein LTS18_006260 [Coniosporium uncinatum]|uniref:Uncharacterized protein n=1 Tax=Coniosporium uncinatum TaxID=93489 RepID=A0ACC3DQF5_9PEZI|nr:hypothetical protein LTS18_006260 [Coniosporium uncinatum]
MPSMTPKKRTLDSFFTSSSPAKKQRTEPSLENAFNHPTYPFPVPSLPDTIIEKLNTSPAGSSKRINDQPDLDLLYHHSFIHKDIARDLFDFLRQHLFFYRVHYKIKRGPSEHSISTPRYTTVFGVDSTSAFSPTPSNHLIDPLSGHPVPKDRYKCRPRPLPSCLQHLCRTTEESTLETFNFCLVNYYADGADSISFHSDDEHFLSPEPAIASFSLGARRDFLMKHKAAVPPNKDDAEPVSSSTAGDGKGKDNDSSSSSSLKFVLQSGDMLLMRGKTQTCWLHSIPKRKGVEGPRAGRINITFRKAVKREGTENYYRYNVGDGEPYRWDEKRGEMVVWKKEG